MTNSSQDDASRSSARRKSRLPRAFGNLSFAAYAAVAVVVLFVVVGALGSIRAVGDFLTFDFSSPISEPQTVIEDDRPDIVLQVESLPRLETTRITIEKVIEAEKSGNALENLFHGDRILLQANGFVTAGVDLSKVAENDVQVNDSFVWVMLPPTEIFVSTLDNKRTEVFLRDKGWLSRGDQELETKARREAEQRILAAACELGIMERSAEDAKAQLTRFVGLLGFREVDIVSRPGECEAPEAGSTS